MITRRTFLASTAGIAAAGAVAAAVGVAVTRRPIPLTLASMRGLVGQSFRDDETGASIRLDDVSGPGGTAHEDAFTLTFRTASTDELPSAIRTLVHGDRALTLHLGPVGPDGDLLEAVVNRTV